MLRDLLEVLAEGNGQSGAHIRSRLGIGRDLYDQLLAQLVRLGFVEKESLASPPGTLFGSGGCTRTPSGGRPPGCAGCPVPCVDNPATGATGVRITDRGLAFVRREGGPGPALAPDLPQRVEKGMSHPPSAPTPSNETPPAERGYVAACPQRGVVCGGQGPLQVPAPKGSFL